MSTWSHAVGLVLAVPACVALWVRGGDTLPRRLSFLMFGLGLLACYGGSTLFHGVQLPKAKLDWFDRWDHVGIFLLIAGSYTPIAWNVLVGAWKWSVLGLAWALAVVGSLLYLAIGVLPSSVGTSIYLGMGWGAVFCFTGLARTFPRRRLTSLVVGGIFYSVGAIFNVLHWPTLWKGTIEAHEVFHVFVLAGSLCHFLFIWSVVLPASSLAIEERKQAVQVSGRDEDGLGSIRGESVMSVDP